MPHSTRPKRPNPSTQKRLQVTDDNGWTHVTTGNNARRTMRGIKSSKNAPSSEQGTTEAQDRDLKPILSPAEAPGRLTLEELQRQYVAHREQWTGSSTWIKLEKILDEKIQELLARTELESESRSVDVDVDVDRIVCIGLGSPSGFLRDGWVDRRSVSMYQLAALERIKERFAAHFTSIPVYAQDPVFNNLDRALLEDMGIMVVEDPVGFESVTRNTLLFCPGAERKHLELVLPSNPGFVFGGPLENTESEVIEKFVGKMQSRALEPFTCNEHAFWMTRLYFREN